MALTFATSIHMVTVYAQVTPSTGTHPFVHCAHFQRYGRVGTSLMTTTTVTSVASRSQSRCQFSDASSWQLSRPIVKRSASSDAAIFRRHTQRTVRPPELKHTASAGACAPRISSCSRSSVMLIMPFASLTPMHLPCQEALASARLEYRLGVGRELSPGSGRAASATGRRAAGCEKHTYELMAACGCAARLCLVIATTAAADYWLHGASSRCAPSGRLLLSRRSERTKSGAYSSRLIEALRCVHVQQSASNEIST